MRLEPGFVIGVIEVIPHVNHLTAIEARWSTKETEGLSTDHPYSRLWVKVLRGQRRGWAMSWFPKYLGSPPIERNFRTASSLYAQMSAEDVCLIPQLMTAVIVGTYLHLTDASFIDAFCS